MPPETLFQIHLVLGYVAWLLCFGVYVLPTLKPPILSGLRKAAPHDPYEI
jgi:hypothetical protein